MPRGCGNTARRWPAPRASQRKTTLGGATLGAYGCRSPATARDTASQRPISGSLRDTVKRVRLATPLETQIDTWREERPAEERNCQQRYYPRQNQHSRRGW